MHGSMLHFCITFVPDAFILKNKSAYSVNEDCGNGGEQIKIKIQTAKKSSYFTISKVPLKLARPK